MLVDLRFVLVVVSLPFGDVSTATHAFIEPRSIEMKQVDFTLLRAHNVKALLVQYIADYLTDDCSVDIIEERNTITTEVGGMRWLAVVLIQCASIWFTYFALT